ncbi:MAG: hypothetical protein ABSE91_00335 [Patescibacteria group bacterium]
MKKTSIRISMILFIILTLGIIGMVVYTYVGPKLNKEDRQIDTWIAKNDLNPYGDPLNTVYSNGKPVKNNNPQTRYDFIIKMHPDKPWEK